VRPMRFPLVQSILAWLFAGWLRLCLGTTRWRRENQGPIETIWEAGGGVIICLWHSRISLSPACWPLDRAQPPRAMASLSPDGEFIAQALHRLGIPTIRGSSSKKSALDKAKGGAEAFREGLRWLRKGGAVALTPDGPRGPAESMAEGAIMLAKMSGAPVLLVGLASAPAVKLDTWDRGVLPLPFARGAIVWCEPIRIDRDAEVAQLQADWAARLSEATRQAEASL